MEYRKQSLNSQLDARSLSHLDGLHVLAVAAVPFDPRRGIGAPHDAGDVVGAAGRHRLLGGDDAGPLGRNCNQIKSDKVRYCPRIRIIL